LTDEYVNSYTTYEAKFSVTMMQADPFLLSDTFNIKIDFAWNTPEIAKGNAAFLKMKYFV